MTIHVNDIYKIQTDRETVRAKTFNTILNRCYAKIRYSVNRDDAYCLITIPEFIVGIPLYNMKKCTKYVILRLQKNGFFIKYYKPNILYIYWKMTELSSSSYLALDSKPHNHNYSKMLTIEPQKNTQYNTPSNTQYNTPSNTGYNTPSNTQYNTPSNTGYNTPSNTGYNTPSNTGYNTVPKSIYSAPSKPSPYSVPDKPSVYSSEFDTRKADYNTPSNTNQNKLQNDNEFSFTLRSNQAKSFLFDNYIPTKKR
jgi:hypothetical protein